MRTFSSFTFDVVEKTFNITEKKELSLLSEWLSSDFHGDEFTIHQLHKLKKHLADKAKVWNEDELKMFFIGPLIEEADLTTDDFQPFTQRQFSATIGNEEIGGRVDFLIAKGRRLPELPYFCIHEYKQEPDKEGDPLGQVLAAMAVAYCINQDNHPILGAYVIGRSWFFVVLEDKQYAISNAYNAADEDIFQIFAILQKSKEIIQRYV